jgi:hypothetical protein
MRAQHQGLKLFAAASGIQVFAHVVQRLGVVHDQQASHVAGKHRNNGHHGRGRAQGLNVGKLGKGFFQMRPSDLVFTLHDDRVLAGLTVYSSENLGALPSGGPVCIGVSAQLNVQGVFGHFFAGLGTVLERVKASVDVNTASAFTKQHARNAHPSSCPGHGVAQGADALVGQFVRRQRV